MNDAHASLVGGKAASLPPALDQLRNLMGLRGHLPDGRDPSAHRALNLVTCLAALQVAALAPVTEAETEARTSWLLEVIDAPGLHLPGSARSMLRAALAFGKDTLA